MILAEAEASLGRYLRCGISPGGCLRSILENDLVSTVGRADPSTMANLREIVRWICANIPNAAWGSPDRVRDWIASESLRNEVLADAAESKRPTPG